MLGKDFRDDILKCISYFSQKTEFDIYWNLCPMQTISKKCQILFSGKNKNFMINLLSAEFTPRVEKVEVHFYFFLLRWGLTTRQPLWVILCRLPEKGRREIVKEMKERDRGERKMNDREEIKTFPLYPCLLQG